MKCKSFNTLYLFPILFISSYRATLFRKMNSDLIFPTCKKIYFKQTVFFRFSQNFIPGLSKFTFLGVINRIHFMSTVFCKI